MDKEAGWLVYKDQKSNLVHVDNVPLMHQRHSVNIIPPWEY